MPLDPAKGAVRGTAPLVLVALERLAVYGVLMVGRLVEPHVTVVREHVIRLVVARIVRLPRRSTVDLSLRLKRRSGMEQP